MVSSKVQIWQLTVWGKGFERQASAMVRSPLFVFFSGLGEAVRRFAGASCLRVQGAFCVGFRTVASARDRLGARNRRGPVDGCVRLPGAKPLFGRAAA
jgi:hypothetical protein